MMNDVAIMKTEETVHRRHSFTNPYSRGLSYFFNSVLPYDPEQARLLSEFIDTPELRSAMNVVISKQGDILAFEIKDKEEYDKLKASLSHTP